MKKITLYTLAVFLLFAHLLTAQEIKFQELNASTELPSNTVYQVFQDSKKYIWLTSEAGLSRYDGEYVMNFSMEDGLTDNEIFGLYEDSQGRIWMRTYNGKPCYFQDEGVYDAYNDPILEEMSSLSWVTSILEDSHQNVYFAMSRSGFMVLTQDNEVIKIKSTELQQLLNDHVDENNLAKKFNKIPSVTGFKELSDGQMCIFSSQAAFIFDIQAQRISVKSVFSREVNQLYFVNDTEILGMMSSQPHQIYHYKDDDFVPILDGNSLDIKNPIPLYLNEKNQLWLGSLSDGAFIVNDFFSTPSVSKRLLEKKSVSSFLLDSEGNQWFSTLGHGVFMKLPNEVLTFTTKQKLSTDDLYSVTVDKNDQIYVGGRNGLIDIIKNGKVIQTLQTDNQKERDYNRINNIIVDDNQTIWASSDLGLTTKGKSVDFDIRNIKALSQDVDGNKYAATSTGVYVIKKNGKVEKIWNRRATSVSPNPDGSVWIGTNKGLYFYDGETTNALQTENSLFGYKVSDLDQTDDGTLCICSGNGLIVKRGNNIAHYTAGEDKIVGNVCKTLFIEKENNTIWMGTSSGISQIILKHKDTTIQKLVNYSQADNLASNDIRGIFAKNGQVWVATSAGLSYFEAKDGKKSASNAPPIYITGVKIWEEHLEVTDAYDLSYNQNHIHIDYTGISHQSGKNIRYMYTMEGIDTGWHYSDIPEIQYPDLHPGFYTFRVKAINIDGEESKFPAEIEFTINSPWWAKWWFRLLSFIVVATAAYLIFSYSVRNRKYKEELQRKIVESEQMALRAQMNPHFVFNALNSIQHFITMEDEMSANYYLTRFSKLIRQVLENSKHSFITLNEEIETLKLYLELEMLRFEGKFEYKIDMEDDISDYDVEIPSMIIQPFLENAIWHGLMPKEGDSKLDIYFSQTDDFIVCSIQDNGIGRKAAAEANKGRDKKHKSTGIANTVQRLQLLSNVKGDNDLMVITDLEQGGRALGTLVTLKIPYK